MQLSHSKPKSYHLAVEEIYLKSYHNYIMRSCNSFNVWAGIPLSGRHELICLIFGYLRFRYQNDVIGFAHSNIDPMLLPGEYEANLRCPSVGACTPCRDRHVTCKGMMNGNYSIEGRPSEYKVGQFGSDWLHFLMLAGKHKWFLVTRLFPTCFWRVMCLKASKWRVFFSERSDVCLSISSWTCLHA